MIDLIISKVKEQIKPTIITGKVISVDTSNNTCDIDVPFEAKKIDVKLGAVEASKIGFLIVPTVGSIVQVAIIGGKQENAVIIKHSKIDKILVTTADGYTLEINNNEVLLNGDNFGGLGIIGKILEKINRLEDKLKNHQHAYVPYPSGVAGPPVLTTPAALPPTLDNTLVFPNTTINEIENEKVKHGG